MQKQEKEHSWLATRLYFLGRKKKILISTCLNCSWQKQQYRFGDKEFIGYLGGDARTPDVPKCGRRCTIG